MQVVTPLRTDDGTIVLFDRGWIPSEKKDPAKRAAGQLPGKVELIGIVRRSQVKRQFAPDNDPAKNFWFHVDVPLMRQMAGGTPDPVLDTFFLEADADAQSRAACRSAARRGSTSPTTICSTPSPGS